MYLETVNTSDAGKGTWGSRVLSISLRHSFPQSSLSLKLQLILLNSHLFCARREHISNLWSYEFELIRPDENLKIKSRQSIHENQFFFNHSISHVSALISLWKNSRKKVQFHTPTPVNCTCATGNETVVEMKLLPKYVNVLFPENNGKPSETYREWTCVSVRACVVQKRIACALRLVCLVRPQLRTDWPRHWTYLNPHTSSFRSHHSLAQTIHPCRSVTVNTKIQSLRKWLRQNTQTHTQVRFAMHNMPRRRVRTKSVAAQV
jgi:hypothetical protein